MNSTQLELRFNQSPNSRLSRKRRRILTQAHWWFRQMHAAVDRAVDRHEPDLAFPGTGAQFLSRRRSDAALLN